MDALTIAAASGMRARMESLDMLANNMANADTSGYKTDREFYNLYVSPEAEAAERIASHPAGDRAALDRFFAGISPSDRQSTRSGSIGKGLFRRGWALWQPIHAEWKLPRLVRRAAGHQRKDTQCGPWVARSCKSSHRWRSKYPPDGTVNQDGQTLGQIEIADFSDPGSVTKQGASYFRSAPRLSRPPE